MQRIVLQLPESFSFEVDVPVRVADLNYGGHVGNDSILTIMQEARVSFYRHLGFQDEIHIDPPIGQIIADAAIVYKAESFLGDILCVQIAVSGHSRHGFDLYYRLTNKASGREVAIGKTGVICFDYEKRRIVTVPEVLKKKIAG